MARILIGVMGPGEQATAADKATAFALGKQIATQGWILLTGGRAAGVMQAASQGAHAAGGLVIGVLPGDTRELMSDAVDIPIVTGMGQARNVINVLSSRVVIACGLGAGTPTEIALTLKLHKPLILMYASGTLQSHFNQLTRAPVYTAETVEAAISKTYQFLELKSELLDR